MGTAQRVYLWEGKAGGMMVVRKDMGGRERMGIRVVEGII